MLTTHLPLLLLAVLVVPLAVLLTWRLLNVRQRQDSDVDLSSGDGLLLAMLALAAFGLGVFLTYVVLSFAH